MPQMEEDKNIFTLSVEEILEQYRLLNDKCEAVLRKIKRKNIPPSIGNK
jgi:hypothetical protein